MNAQELRAKTPDELREELVNLKKEGLNLRFQQATGQLENTAADSQSASCCGPSENHSERKSGCRCVRRLNQCLNVS